MGKDIEQLKTPDSGLSEIVGAEILLLIKKGNQNIRHIEYFLLGKLALPPGPFNNIVKPDGMGGFRSLVYRYFLIKIIFHAVPDLGHVGPAGGKNTLNIIECKGCIENMFRG
jgi:hypothetical protein